VKIRAPWNPLDGNPFALQGRVRDLTPVNHAKLITALVAFLNVFEAEVVTRSEVWICGRSLAGIAGSNPAGSMDVCLL
jgi:hypothetical protein